MLTRDQPSYAGRFRSGRDGVLVRDEAVYFSAGGIKSLFVLAWDGAEMKVHKQLRSPFDGRWGLAPADRFVLGDFHRSGTDVADLGKQYVHDGLTDVFIHNGWGTGTVGVNHGEHPDRPGDLAAYVDQIGLTWIQRGILMDDS